jgi:hypothetical protein
MPRAEQDHALGNFNAPVNFPGDVSRIYVSSVRNEAGSSANFLFFAAREKRIDRGAQSLRIIWIKPAGDSRKANHGEPWRLISVWRVCP